MRETVNTCSINLMQRRCFDPATKPRPSTRVPNAGVMVNNFERRGHTGRSLSDHCRLVRTACDIPISVNDSIGLQLPLLYSARAIVSDSTAGRVGASRASEMHAGLRRTINPSQVAINLPVVSRASRLSQCPLYHASSLLRLLHSNPSTMLIPFFSEHLRQSSSDRTIRIQIYAIHSFVGTRRARPPIHRARSNH